MNYLKLRKLKEKKYFGTEDLRDLLGIKQESARVLCSRYAKSGLFVRLKKNFYVLAENWENFGQDDFFKTANLLQVPSYISFLSALSFYEVSTQQQQDFFESASLKRSVKAKLLGKSFNYYKLKKGCYFDFIKKDGFFIATKEKAFADTLYLYSFGKYKFDMHAIDKNKLDTRKLKNVLKKFPLKTRKMANKICRI